MRNEYKSKEKQLKKEVNESQSREKLTCERVINECQNEKQELIQRAEEERS